MARRSPLGRLAAALLLAAAAELQTGRDLASHYSEIFPTGNRNAASHKWTSFVLERAGGLDAGVLQGLFRGFCPVSGSPLPDAPDTRYHVTLPRVSGGQVA